MQVLMTILYIILFLVFLSILIMIHELGHLIAAKAFKVYCLEYSIGMGPLLFKFKRKNGETQFSLRGIPFGGYVSMYGEGVPLPEGVTVDESRSLNGIKPWKRAIVLLAGVTMNAILALVFFFVTNCFPQESIDYVNHLNVANTVTGLTDGDFIKFEPMEYHDSVSNKDRVFYFADDTTYLNDDESVKYATCFNFDSLTSYKHLDLSEHIYFYELRNVPVGLFSKVEVTDYNNQTIYISNDGYHTERAFKLLLENHIITDYSIELFDYKNPDYQSDYENLKIECINISELAKKVDDGGIAIMPRTYIAATWSMERADEYQRLSIDHLVPDFEKNVKPEFNKATIHFIRRIQGPKGGHVDGEIVPIEISQVDGKVQPFGCSIYYIRTQYSFGGIIKHTFIDFGKGSVAIFQALGELITKPSSWGNVSGIIGIGYQTTAILKENGFISFLRVWGIISVNLAIFNLIPFPGLDGWQLLVLGVETTMRKKIPEKVKNTVSLVGILLLLGLMVLIVFKDIFTFVI